MTRVCPGNKTEIPLFNSERVNLLHFQKILSRPHLKKILNALHAFLFCFFTIRFNISWNYMKINLSLFLDWGPDRENEWEGWGWTVAHRILFFSARGRKESALARENILDIFLTECWVRCRFRLDDEEQRDIYCSCLERNPRFLAYVRRLNTMVYELFRRSANVGLGQHHCWGFKITIRHTYTHTQTRYPVSGWSVRRRGLYRHNTQWKRDEQRYSNPQSQISRDCALDRTITCIGGLRSYACKITGFREKSHMEVQN